MNDFTKAGKPRNWKGQKSKIEELENELSLVKDSYVKEIDRITLQLNKNKEVITQQAKLIDKYVGDLEAFQYSYEKLAEKLRKLESRSLWERIVNKKIES